MEIAIKEYRTRLQHLKRALDRLPSTSTIVLPTGDKPYKSHDQQFPFFQDRDFLYFTGLSTLENAALALSSQQQRPTLFVQKVSDHQRTWDGAGFDPIAAAKKLGIALVEVEDLLPGIREYLKGSESLYLNSARSKTALKITESLLHRPLYELQTQRLPTTITHSQLLTSPLRAVKSDAEIQMIRNAVSLTESALVEVLQITRPGCTEIQLARLFSSLVREAGGSLAFEPIVASGPNAAVLHHTPSTRKLQRGDLVLFDVGAEFGGYNGDISRTVSLGAAAHIDKLLLDVDAAQERIAKLLKIGAKYAKIKSDAIDVMANAVVKSGLPVSGPSKKIVKNGEIKKFFPHSFGHSLGLDVHDPLAPDTVLTAGMVFTVEPGIYLAKKLGKYPALGIRIEDDFFVSKTGPKIFSSIPQLISL